MNRKKVLIQKFKYKILKKNYPLIQSLIKQSKKALVQKKTENIDLWKKNGHKRWLNNDVLKMMITMIAEKKSSNILMIFDFYFS